MCIFLYYKLILNRVFVLYLKHEKRRIAMKKALALTLAAAMALGLAACGNSGGTSGSGSGSGASSGSGSTSGSNAATEVANKDKPLVWFNRQPSNSSTGELDITAPPASWT